jgi:hypothetical protein
MGKYDFVQSGLDLGIKASQDAPPEELVKGGVDVGIKFVESMESIFGAAASAQFGKVIVKEFDDDIPEDVITNDMVSVNAPPSEIDWNLEEDAIIDESVEATSNDILPETGVALDNPSDDSLENGQYGFNGVDCFADIECLDSALSDFKDENWEVLSLEEQKQSMENLADYVIDVTGNENPPEIVFRDDMGEGEYGGYNPSSNTLEINENMLSDSSEAADTVAHELWHAYQEQCALDPNSEKGKEYQEGFDNYISPEYDFEGYQDQLVEAEARAFAQNFKDRMAEGK